jgi:hypothetical protein
LLPSSPSLSSQRSAMFSQPSAVDMSITRHIDDMR